MSMSGPEVIQVDEIRVISERPIVYSTEEEARLVPPLLSRMTRLTILGLVLLLPIPFGGVHLDVQALVAAFETSPLSRFVIVSLLLFGAYLVLQSIFLSLATDSHPVLGTSGRILRSSEFWSGITLFAYFVCVYVLARTYLALYPRFSHYLINAILASGVLVSLIALSHWFYDTGKLFWVFEPEHIFVSERARWPFVNSNHLGHFLLPIFFLMCAKLGNLVTLLAQRHNDQSKTLSTLALSGRVQSRIMKIAFAFSFLVAILLSIVGTLSRGTWLGLAVGTLSYFLLSRSALSPLHDGDSSGLTERKHRSGRTRRKSSSAKTKNWSFESILKISRRCARPTFLIVGGIMLFFFLSERGQDLVANRLDYGLMASKDDMRWQLYQDTLSMIADHPIIGVGLGGWAAEYSRYMAPELSGVNPVYLHSEPLQLLAECGILGAALIALLWAGASTLGVRSCFSLGRRKMSEARYQIALLSGLFGLTIASFFDFPLRMPAIASLLAIYLCLTAFYSDLSNAD
jgi:hypothetical protein